MARQKARFLRCDALSCTPERPQVGRQLAALFAPPDEAVRVPTWTARAQPNQRQRQMKPFPPSSPELGGSVAWPHSPVWVVCLAFWACNYCTDGKTRVKAIPSLDCTFNVGTINTEEFCEVVCDPASRPPRQLAGYNFSHRHGRLPEAAANAARGIGGAWDPQTYSKEVSYG